MANAGFENAIKNYLDKRAESDRLFAVSYKKENKSIQECCKYIYSQAKKLLAKGGNAVGVDDDTVYGWAVHYYDEDDMMAYKIYEYLKSYPSKLGLNTDFDWAFEHVFRKEVNE